MRSSHTHTHTHTQNKYYFGSREYLCLCIRTFISRATERKYSWKRQSYEMRCLCIDRLPMFPRRGELSYSGSGNPRRVIMLDLEEDRNSLLRNLGSYPCLPVGTVSAQMIWIFFSTAMRFSSLAYTVAIILSIVYNKTCMSNLILIITVNSYLLLYPETKLTLILLQKNSFSYQDFSTWHCGVTELRHVYLKPLPIPPPRYILLKKLVFHHQSDECFRILCSDDRASSISKWKRDQLDAANSDLLVIN
jgi:hypothetical protein